MELETKYQNLSQAIMEGDQDAGLREARTLVESGLEVGKIFDQGIVPTLTEVGHRFERLEIFLPEMMFAAEVVKAIHQELAGSLEDHTPLQSPGIIVIGTAFGDIHDLGKNIVATMLEVNGFTVHDLGVNVEPMDFLRKARDVDADIIAISSLLMTSIPYMADVIEIVKSNASDRERYKTLIGGGPVTPEVAQEVGADAYGDNAADAVQQARRLIGAA